MAVTLEQGEELRGGTRNVVDLELAGVDLVTQELLHAALHGLWTGLPEQLAELFRTGATARVEQAIERNRLGRGDQRKERMPDCLELAPHGRVLVHVEQGGRHLLLAARTDRGEEQRLLVLEVAVDGELGHPGLGRDRIHAGALETALRKQALGGFEDRGALLEVLWATRAAA